MACKKQTVPFAGTPEQEAQLKAVIAELKDQPGSLMPVMQKAQDIYGYLPIEVQTMISVSYTHLYPGQRNRTEQFRRGSDAAVEQKRPHGRQTDPLLPVFFAVFGLIRPERRTGYCGSFPGLPIMPP